MTTPALALRPEDGPNVEKLAAFLNSVENVLRDGAPSSLIAEIEAAGEASPAALAWARETRSVSRTTTAAKREVPKQSALITGGGTPPLLMLQMSSVYRWAMGEEANVSAIVAGFQPSYLEQSRHEFGSKHLVRALALRHGVSCTTAWSGEFASVGATTERRAVLSLTAMWQTAPV